jgi:hypothetical protein
LKNGVSAKDCIFLDSDIYRKDIKSCGHHIVLFRNSEIPQNWDNFSNCLNPNILRMRSFKDGFRFKYPMATIHLLLAIVGQKINIKFSEDALYPILQADGTINRCIDKYTDNLLDWLNYLDVSDEKNALHNLFYHKVNLMELSQKYVDYTSHYVKGKRDKIPISLKDKLIKSSFNNSLDKFSEECKNQIENYLNFIAKNTGWSYFQEKWLLYDFKIFNFTKKTPRPGVHTYNDAVRNNFLSLAITSNTTMEYTLERPDKLF